MTDRRGNGLLADAYVPLILLPPALADTMLEALGRAGIAAYAIPLDEDVLAPSGTTGEETPTDHLYVDANERTGAEEILRAELPELAERHPLDATVPADGDDDVWADLVARFYDSDAPPGRAWPDAENATRRPEGDLLDSPEPEHDVFPAPRSRLFGPSSEPENGHRERPGGPAEDDEHFVPPPPPPLPRGDLTGRLAWSGLLGGPSLLLVATVLGLRIPGWLVLGVLGAFVAGFVVLLIRMGDRPPRDSGPDDGAVI